jgi:uncharacterized protein
MCSLDQHLSHKNLVMITGATGGLGKALAVECASRGWDLFLTDLAADRLEILAAGLHNGYGVKVWVHACDLTDPVGRASLFDTIHSDSLRFWGLINVAGIDYEGPFFEQTSQQIRTILRLNIEATLEMTHAILAYRNPLAPFRIVNVASLAAFYPMPVKATYAASKRFLLDFSLALREEVRSLGATVTVLCPAGLPTTPECIRAIEAQGWLGQITTQNVGGVAHHTIQAALAGHPVVIPGMANRFLQLMGSLLPTRLLTHLIGSRWKSAQNKRQLPRELVTA